MTVYLEDKLREKLGRTHVICENCWHEVQVWPDPTVKQKAYPAGGAYDNLGPVTDKPTIIPNPRGRYAQARWPEFRQTHPMPIVQFNVIDESWLNSKPLNVQEGIETEHVPALSKLLHGGN